MSKQNKDSKTLMSRRKFLKTAVTGAAVATAGIAVAKEPTQSAVTKSSVDRGYDAHSAHVKAYYKAASF